MEVKERLKHRHERLTPGPTVVGSIDDFVRILLFLNPHLVEQPDR